MASWANRLHEERRCRRANADYRGRDSPPEEPRPSRENGYRGQRDRDLQKRERKCQALVRPQLRFRLLTEVRASFAIEYSLVASVAVVDPEFSPLESEPNVGGRIMQLG